MNKKIKEYFKDVCIRTSKLSTCVSKQVGVVLIKDLRIIAIGYNGVPSGVKHCNEKFDENNFDREEHHDWSHLNENHAEQNLVSFCAKNGIIMNNTILLISMSPCINCAKIILNSGVKKIIFIEWYDLSDDGVKFLNNNNIECVNYDEWI